MKERYRGIPAGKSLLGKRTFPFSSCGGEYSFSFCIAVVTVKPTVYPDYSPLAVSTAFQPLEFCNLLYYTIKLTIGNRNMHHQLYEAVRNELIYQRGEEKLQKSKNPGLIFYVYSKSQQKQAGGIRFE